MFYESWNPGTVIYDDGMPLVSGRVTVYVHDSNHLADIYTLEGANYVPASNPLRLDEAGRLPATLYMELGVYDIKLEKYNGDGNFEDFDWFSYGIDAKLDQIGATEVADIQALQDLDPNVSGKIVNVTSEPRRTYIWDEYSTDTPDSGIVVSSDVKGTGNWILLWDSPYLPSTIYGVKGSNSDNISAFLTYQQTAGSMGIAMPPVAFLVSGYYDLQVNYTSTHKLAFDTNTHFNGTISVPCDIEVMGSQDTSIGNIYFLNRDCTARSSWYPDVTSFWSSGADIFVCENTNHFSNTILQNSVALNGKTVIGHGTLVTGYTSGCKFIVNQAASIPDGFFSVSDYVQVQSDIGDRIFNQAGTWDPGLISAGHHHQFDQQPTLAGWHSVNRWLKVMLERKSRLLTMMTDTLDFENRVSTGFTLETGSFTVVRNARPSSNIVVKDPGVTLYNVTATVQPNGTDISVSAWDSTITIPANHPGLTNLQARNSRISVPGSSGLNPANTQIGLVDCTYSGAIYLSNADADAYVMQKPLSINGCEIQNNLTWRVNQIQMQDTSIFSKIDILPVRADDGYYYYNVNLQNCHFLGSSRVRLTVYCTYDVPHIDMDAHVKFNNVHIVNNQFDTSDQYGIKMIFWHPFTYNRIIANPVGSWVYYGNRGNCPRLAPPFIMGANEFPNAQGTSYKWKVTTREYNIWCPYAYFADGSLYSVDTDPAGLGLDPAPLAEVTGISDLSNHPSFCFYAYRRYDTTLTDYTDEDQNNMFRVLVGVGYKLPSVTSFENCRLTFPLPSPEE